MYEEIIESGSCVAFGVGSLNHPSIDAWAKDKGMTVVFAEWHPNPEYRIFKTGSLLSRNDDYPAGLVFVNEDGTTKRFLG